jgi:enoyl-CoA hydratase
MTKSDRPVIRVDRQGPIAEVVFDRAEKLNAMGPGFWELCPKVFDELNADPEVRCVIVRAEGRMFSAGLDLMVYGPKFQEFFGATAGARGGLMALIKGAQEAIDAIDRCRVPVIAAIHGKCLGGGLDVAAACCIRLCTRDAQMAIAETKIGIVADLGSLQRLPRAIGFSATRELAYTGNPIGADRALSLGLVSEVFEDQEALLEGARKLAGTIGEPAPRGSGRQSRHAPQ